MIKKLDRTKTFGSDIIITILEIGEAILESINLNQIDQAISMVDNRDRLINIFKENAKDDIDQKAISKILNQDSEIIKNLEASKVRIKKDYTNLSKNKTKIDRYRQVSE